MAGNNGNSTGVRCAIRCVCGYVREGKDGNRYSTLRFFGGQIECLVPPEFQEGRNYEIIIEPECTMLFREFGERKVPTWCLLLDRVRIQSWKDLTAPAK